MRDFFCLLGDIQLCVAAGVARTRARAAARHLRQQHRGAARQRAQLHQVPTTSLVVFFLRKTAHRLLST